MFPKIFSPVLQVGRQSEAYKCFGLREVWMPTSLGSSPDASTTGVTSDTPLHFSEPQFLLL